MGSVTSGIGRSCATTKEKRMVKLAIDSPEAKQLLADCHVVPAQVECNKKGQPLINAWKAVVDGSEVTFCHSVKDLDDKTHIRDLSGRVTTLTGGRDRFIQELFLAFRREKTSSAEDRSAGGGEFAQGDLPLREDVEAAYRILAEVHGPDVPVSAVLQQVERDLTRRGVVLEEDWEARTEANLKAWATD